MYPVVVKMEGSTPAIIDNLAVTIISRTVKINAWENQSLLGNWQETVYDNF